MALYKYTTKAGQFYGVRFRVVEADGVERHKNLRGFTTQRAARQAQYEYERENSAHLVQKKEGQAYVACPFLLFVFQFFGGATKNRGARYTPTPASKLYIYAIFCIIIHSPVPHGRYYCCVMLTFFWQLRFPPLFAAKPQNCAEKR